MENINVGKYIVLYKYKVTDCHMLQNTGDKFKAVSMGTWGSPASPYPSGFPGPQGMGLGFQSEKMLPPLCCLTVPT